jgi:hypothetical protein
VGCARPSHLERRLFGYRRMTDHFVHPNVPRGGATKAPLVKLRRRANYLKLYTFYVY